LGTTGTGKTFVGVNDAGYTNQVVYDGSLNNGSPNSENGVSADWLVNVRGQYLKVATTTANTKRVTTAENAIFEGTGYLASPYFGYTAGNQNRDKMVIGLHKSKYTTELKAGYTVTPYNLGKSYTVSSVQSDVQATMTEAWTATFSNIEFQIGNIETSGTFNYPDTSKQDVYGSWPPNPTKFTTELKDGYTLKCKSSGCGGTNVRILHILNDQHLRVLPRFTTTFADKQMMIEIGPRATGLHGGTAGNTRLQGSDPCRVSNGEPCHGNTRFLTELRVNDRIKILENGTLTSTMSKTVSQIQDDAHIQLHQTLDRNIFTSTKFQILSFHSTPFTYARKATGGLKFAGTTTSGTTNTLQGYNGATFTKNLMAGYAIITKISGSHYERRYVKSIDSATSLTLDAGFTASFDFSSPTPAPSHVYTYESCPSLTYENFDLRTENGFGVISNTGTNMVYDNVQYSQVTTQTNATAPLYAARFLEYLKVGYTITLDGITRTVTKMVDNTLIHIDRAFKTGTAYDKYSYRYSVRKTGDFHLHWKPRTEWGDYHTVHNATDAMIYSRSMIASATSDGTVVSEGSVRDVTASSALNSAWWLSTSQGAGYVTSTSVEGGGASGANTGISSGTASYTGTSGVTYGSGTQGAPTAASSSRANPSFVSSYGKQNLYLKYPPVCYNAGRCVPKTSHSLVGVESPETSAATSKVLTSALPHQSPVVNYVSLSLTDGTSPNHIAMTDPALGYTKDCKPAGACTITVRNWRAGAVAGSPATNIAETRRVLSRINTTFVQTEQTFKQFSSDATGGRFTRVRYVTGTGTVKTSAGCASAAASATAATLAACHTHNTASKPAYTVTGASKETKTKFNSEVSHGWTITICATTTSKGKCNTAGTTETALIAGVTSDTYLTTSQAFTQSFYKRKYQIGKIPALGLVSSAQASKIVDGDTNTRFLQQMKVGYKITVNSEEREITAISSNSQLTIASAFSTPPTTKTSALFSGKEGTGEVTVNAVTSGSCTDTGTPAVHPGTAHPNIYTCAEYDAAGALKSAAEPKKTVVGTSDITQTKFQNELALGYLFMVGVDYKVVTNILSDTILEVDTPFTTATHAAYDRNDYNYESCWLHHPTAETAQAAATDQNGYTNRKVYVEDACEIKPGCCGFKVSSVVFPDRFAYYKIRPPHTNMNIRVVVKTTEDNVDVLVKKSAVPTTSTYDYKSVRESNPWALTIPQTAITCGTFAGWSANLPPQNCDYWYIGVRGDNRYPQKTGASEYDLYVYTEFDWPNFVCSDASSAATNDALGRSTKCQWLGLKLTEDGTMHTNDDDQHTMRLTDNTAQRKGSLYYSTKVHLYDGFETTFQFRMTGFSVGCNSVLYPSGFCGGGDGFAFIIQPHDDTKIGCTGSGLGFAQVLASKQGNDWSRHRCKSNTGSTTATLTGASAHCDTNDDGTFAETCVVGALCCHPDTKHSLGVSSCPAGTTAAPVAVNGGCGSAATCGFQDCTDSISQVLAVEFDTWNNLRLHDPKQGVSRWWINATEFVGYNDNHIAIFSSNGKMESDHALNAHFAATPSVPNLADGKNHTVKIKYWPQLIDVGMEHDGDYNLTNFKLRSALHTSSISTSGDCMDTGTTTASPLPSPDDCFRSLLRNNKPGNLAIFVDDMKRPVLQTQVSLRKGATSNCYDNDRDRCILDERGNAYIGFTASTGGERAGGRTAAGAHVVQPTGQAGNALENAGKMLGAAQNHEILSWKFCNKIGCVPI
jgi:hypothetical protein